MAIQYTATDFLNKIQNSYSYTNAYRKKVLESNEDVETLQVDVAGLKKTVKDLGKYSKGLTSKTRLEKQLKSFVKTYNSMDKDAAKLTDDELGKQMEKFEKLLSDNEKILKKIGLKKSNDKLVLDSDILKEADDKIINQLFEGKDSFIKRADKIMQKIEAWADDSQYRIVQRNMIKTTKYDKDDVTLANSFIQAKESTEKLGNISNQLLDAGALSEEDKKKIESNFKILINIYDIANNYEDEEDCNKLIDLCKEKKEELAKVGITIEEESKTMKYVEPNFDDSDFQSVYKSLFGKDSEFAKSIVDCCNNGFNNILKNKLKPEDVGVSIVDVYA